jgi:nucleotide-binding universal stress UspA family protein
MENTNCKILAVLGGLGTLVHAEHTAELACHLCEGRNAKLLLAYTIIVPHALPLEASLPEQERAARKAIERGLRAAAPRGCNAEARIVRHRHAADAVLELARAEKVEAIVLGVRINVNVPVDYDAAESAEAEILRRAPCEVIVDREPIVA